MKDSDLIFGLMASFGKKEYSIADLLHLIKPFNITENSLRTNLSRMKNNAILDSRKDGKTVFYKFYTRGKKINSIAELSFNPPVWEGWNNEWFGVLFTVSENKKKIRYQLRKRLIAYRFALKYPGFWIRPMHQAENKKYNFKTIFENEYSRLIQFNFSNLPEISEIQTLWNIHSINKEFFKGKSQINFIKNNIMKKNAIEALKIKMEIGEKIVKLFFKDPLLPPEFLPSNWKGIELRKEFIDLDKQLTEISKPYWNKIFN